MSEYPRIITEEAFGAFLKKHPMVPRTIGKVMEDRGKWIIVSGANHQVEKAQEVPA